VLIAIVCWSTVYTVSNRRQHALQNANGKIGDCVEDIV